MNELIYVRVMEHDTEDSIRIGIAFPIENTKSSIETNALSIKDAYEKKTAWCGGFKSACLLYYRRIAIINADTMEVIYSIYNQKEAI